MHRIRREPYMMLRKEQRTCEHIISIEVQVAIEC